LAVRKCATRSASRARERWGCYVVDGVLKRDAQVRVVRDGAIVYTSKLSSLKRFKDDASEVRTGSSAAPESRISTT